jgi:plasmid rolling circle replication initiator protein Rep
MQPEDIIGTSELPSEFASLVYLETSQLPLRWNDTSSQKVLHRRWTEQRKATIDAMFNGSEALVKRAERIQGCCSHPILTSRNNGESGVVLFCCRDRMCPRCQAGRSIETSKKISTVIGNMNAPRQVELTVKHKQAKLSVEIDRLWDSFRKLRKSKFWKKVCVGGIGVLEITLNPKTRLWHPHLHLVFDGQYCPQDQLSKEWKNATGDSEIVWIQAVHDRAKTAHYVAKYLSKSANPSDMEPCEIREFAESIHGRRLVFTFGKLAKTNVDPKPKEKLHAGDTPILLLSRLVDASRIDFPNAKKAVQLIAGHNYNWAAAMGINPFESDITLAQMSTSEHQFVIETCKAIAEHREKVVEEKRQLRLSKYKGGGEHQQQLGDFCHQQYH